MRSGKLAQCVMIGITLVGDMGSENSSICLQNPLGAHALGMFGDLMSA